MKGYKLTNKEGKTHHSSCQWGENVKHEIAKPGNKMCTDQVFHYYDDPLLAVFANPIHGRYDQATMRLWECEVGEKVNGDSLKSATKKLTTLHEIPVPAISTYQRVKIAILSVKEVHHGQSAWNKWADSWLSGADRTYVAAFVAAHAATFVAADVAYAAFVAAHAAHAAADVAAYAAAHAADVAADVAYATFVAAHAAHAAADVAADAAHAAHAAADAAIDIISIIHSVCDEEERC